MYASFLVISRALHLNVFDQPGENHFFNNRLKGKALAQLAALLLPEKDSTAMFIARVIITMVAIMIIAYLFPGILWVDGFGAALAASFILGIINAIIRPILIFLTLPLTVVTFGFFLLILNGLLLGLVSFFVPGFYVNGLGGGMLGSILISFVSWVLSVSLGPRQNF